MLQYVHGSVEILYMVAWSLRHVAEVAHCPSNGVQRYMFVEIDITYPSDEIAHVEVK